MTIPLTDNQGPVLLPSYTYANLPASASPAGRLAWVTDSDWHRGVWIDTGTTWEPLAQYSPKNDSSLPAAAGSGRTFFLSPGAGTNARGLYYDEGYSYVHAGLGVANALDFGAPGSAAVVTVASRYGNNQAGLDAAKARYTTLTDLALTDALDWAAIQHILNSNMSCYLPPNHTYVVNRPIVLRNNTSLFSLGYNPQNLTATIACPSGYTYTNLIQNWGYTTSWTASQTTATGDPSTVDPGAYVCLYGVNIDILSGASLYHPVHLAMVDANSFVSDISVDLEGCTVSSAVMKFSAAPAGAPNPQAAQNFTVRNLNLFHASGTNTVARLIDVAVGNGFTLEKCNLTVAAANSGVTTTAVKVRCDNGYAVIRDINFEGSVADQVVLEINGMAVHTVDNCHFKCTAQGCTAIQITGSDSYKPYVIKGCGFRIDGSSQVWKYVIDDAVTGATDRSIMPEGFCPTTRFTGEVFAIEYWDGQRGSLIGNGGTAYEDTRQAVQYFGSQKHCFVHQFASRDGGSYTAGDLIWSAVDNTLYRCTATGVVSEGAWAGTTYGVGRWVTQAGTVYRCIKPTNATGFQPPNATYWESKGTALASFQAITLANLVPNYVYTTDNPTAVLTWTAGNYSRVGVWIEAIGIDMSSDGGGTGGTAKYMKAFYTLDRGALAAGPTTGDRTTADRHYYVLRGENITPNDGEDERDFTMTLANPSGSTWTATMAFTDWANPYITIRVVEDSAGTVTLVQTA